MNAAFIPVRGGSKSIPLKNIKSLAGKPLVWYAAKAANDCKYIERVYIATDSDEIKSVVLSFGLDKVEVIDRSEKSACDTASTECAMLEFAAEYDFENIVLIQATSPLITSFDLDKGLEAFYNGADSVVSVVSQKRFIWENNPSGFAKPINYDFLHRPRRQEFDGFLVENGAFYITSKTALLKSGCRISGKIKTVKMPDETYFEIDEASDWLIIEKLLSANKQNKNIGGIRLLATDCDGVLTDGGMYYGENGDELKKFNAKDGHGFLLLRKMGIKTAIISGENNKIIMRRGQKVAADDIILGRADKLDALKELCAKYDLTLEQCAYIGDDIFDIPAIAACGFGCAPADALEEVKAAADYISSKKGGEGTFRDVVEKLKTRE